MNMVFVMTNKESTIKKGWNLENTYLTLPQKFYSKVKACPVSEPKLIILNDILAKELGLSAQELQGREGINILAGNSFPKGSLPIAQAYSGHQFGHFTSLGDGRAVLIGEQRTPDNILLDIQLKGGGATPYSRGGDGRASVGPMLREYILSEAMYHLGVPTTRSLSVVATKDMIYREKLLKGAVLCRVANSHIRVGTFEFASKFGSEKDLRALADYTINRHYQECIDKENPYLEFLKGVIKKQADLVSKWMLFAFIHGVMNTDNMSIAGETIDYGPCAFMDIYRPATVFSSIDKQGRYAYGNQPNIAGWNLAVFAETLLPLLSDNKEKAIEAAKKALGDFHKLYFNEWFLGMKSKLGLVGEDRQDIAIIMDLLELLEKFNVDFTYFFTLLTVGELEEMDLLEFKDYKEWQGKWENRLSSQDGGIAGGIKLMEKSNPWIIPRNREVERVLKAAVEEENYTPLHELLERLSKPFDYSQVGQENLKPPEPSGSHYKTYCGT